MGKFETKLKETEKNLRGRREQETWTRLTTGTQAKCWGRRQRSLQGWETKRSLTRFLLFIFMGFLKQIIFLPILSLRVTSLFPPQRKTLDSKYHCCRPYAMAWSRWQPSFFFLLFSFYHLPSPSTPYFLPSYLTHHVDLPRALPCLHFSLL